MADVSPFVYGFQLTPAHTNLSWNSTNTKFAWVVQAPKTGNIRKIKWRTGGTVSSSQSVTISLQDVSATTGYPDGTADQSATRATIAASTWYQETLSTDRAVTRGDVFAIVFEWTSTAGTAEITVISGALTNTAYMAAYVSGAWQKGLGGTNRGFIGTIEYDDGGIYPVRGAYPVTITNTDYNNAGTYTELGLYVVPQVQMVVSGFMWDGRATGDCTGILYNADGSSVLESATLDKDVGFSTTDTNNFFLFDTDVTLSAGVGYNFMIRPDTTTNVRLNYGDANAAGDLAALAPWGTSGYLARKTSGGVWSNVTTTRPWIFPIVNGLGGSSSAQRSWGHFG